MHAEYKHNIAMAEADESVRVIVVTGSGSAFCVGGDSDALEGATPTVAAMTTALPQREIRSRPATSLPRQSSRLRGKPGLDQQFAYHFGLTKPVIAAINGPAAGVGLALAVTPTSGSQNQEPS